MQGSGDLPDRGWRGVYELSAVDFLAGAEAAKADPRQLGEWAAEAAKRFGVPLLAIGHTLFAMALALTFGNVTGRRGAGGGLTIMAVPVAHIAFLVSLEALLRINAAFALLLAAVVAAEIGLSLWLIARLNYSPTPARLDATLALRESYAAPVA
jgi:lipopolysaccharide export system permease protein